ncbi:restriction endonuclease subunit S [Pontibacter sp. MBLB2868]|uniref:restriction endonuclease subunit S n=1 Tax=Pontibacter sp. MBLB2868 TaxID=3451555 RepID=UPI003F74E69F
MNKVEIRKLIKTSVPGEWGSEPIGDELDFIVLRSTNFTNKGIVNAKDIVLRNIPASKISSRKLNKGDILLEKSGGSPDQPVGRVVYFEEGSGNYTCSNFIQRLEPIDEVDSRYLFYTLFQNYQELKVLKYQQQTTGLINFKLEDYLSSEKVFLPERKAEQQKIAKILRTVDGQIEKTEAIIAKYKAIKQGLMQDLFTRGIDVATGKLRPRYQDAPELYKPSPLGMIPKDWDIESIGSLTEKVGSGVTPTGGSEVYLNEGVLFIRSQNVLTGELSLEDAAYISETINEKMAGSKVIPNDVLLNITGASIGRCAYYPSGLGEANVNQHVCIIRFNEVSHELAVFASTFLNSHFGQNQIYRLNAGGNREGLNYQQIRSFSFPKIENKEIKAISEKLEAMASKIKSEEESLSKLQLLKKGLMSDLLSGKVRVQVDERAIY